jgi:hypothetical protein
MPAPVRFEPMRNLDGFDAGPFPSQMVPVEGSKDVRVLNARGLRVDNFWPSVMEVKEMPRDSRFPGDRIFRLSGRIEHVDSLSAWSPAGERLGQLSCQVRAKRKVTVTFNFVKDTAGHQTKRPMATVDALIEGLNDIYGLQANVAILKSHVREVKVARDLHRIVGPAGKSEANDELGSVTALRDSRADINVFFVWDFEFPGRQEHRSSGGSIGTNCLVDDTAIDSIQVLAHEMGHSLGLPNLDGKSEKDRLMYSLEGSGRRLTASDVRRMVARLDHMKSQQP